MYRRNLLRTEESTGLLGDLGPSDGIVGTDGCIDGIVGTNWWAMGEWTTESVVTEM